MTPSSPITFEHAGHIGSRALPLLFGRERHRLDGALDLEGSIVARPDDGHGHGSARHRMLPDIRPLTLTQEDMDVPVSPIEANAGSARAIKARCAFVSQVDN